jgi:hypothetical protein
VFVIRFVDTHIKCSFFFFVGRNGGRAVVAQLNVDEKQSSRGIVDALNGTIMAH